MQSLDQGNARQVPNRMDRRQLEVIVSYNSEGSISDLFNSSIWPGMHILSHDLSLRLWITFWIEQGAFGFYEIIG